MTDIAQQLRDLEARRKRWMTRLTRAHTALKYLEAKRLRLLKRLGPSQINPPSLGTDPQAADPRPPHGELSTGIGAAPPQAGQLEKFVAKGMAAQKAVDDLLDIPEELRVTADVEKLRAERRKKEEADRHKMPLTGKAAMAAIRRKK